MTVSELIALLKREPADAIIVVDDDGMPRNATSVVPCKFTTDGTVSELLIV